MLTLCNRGFEPGALPPTLPVHSQELLSSKTRAASTDEESSTPAASTSTAEGPDEELVPISSWLGHPAGARRDMAAAAALAGAPEGLLDTAPVQAGLPTGWPAASSVQASGTNQEPGTSIPAGQPPGEAASGGGQQQAQQLPGTGGPGSTPSAGIRDAQQASYTGRAPSTQGPGSVQDGGPMVSNGSARSTSNGEPSHCPSILLVSLHSQSLSVCSCIRCEHLRPPCPLHDMFPLQVFCSWALLFSGWQGLGR
jgi:hypothetical protein